ncbi:MAG: hypothetical protein AAGH67_03955 [Cyanobacteria bacterium P01_H01_bin.162]
METSLDESLAVLELLIPWDLPLEQHLSPTDKSRIDQALRQLLQALAQPSPQAALISISQALTALGEVDTQTASIQSTQTSLKAWEVEDYDRYFQIRHVHTEQSALCLVRGLLLTCQKFFEIHMQTPWLDTRQVKQQQQGFISYIELLQRTFDLDTDYSDAAPTTDPHKTELP